MEDKSKILVIEDNTADVHLLQIALEAAGVQAELEHAADGEEAVKIVSGTNGRRPKLIVLDVNLPKISGDEVLRKIRVQPNLAKTPVLVFTSSQAEEDRSKMERLGANAFVTKGRDLREFLQVGQILKGMLAAAA
jgi:two-component system, chemotaxis family, response regulator Rcp1